MPRYIDADLIGDRVSHGLVDYEVIKAIPTADVVEVIHAHWIENWESGWSDCSHCGKGFLWEDYKGVGDWNYCPNCGAKMEVK